MNPSVIIVLFLAVQTFLLFSILVQLFVVRRHVRLLRSIEIKFDKAIEQKTNQENLEIDLNTRMAQLQRSTFGINPRRRNSEQA